MSAAITDPRLDAAAAYLEQMLTPGRFAHCLGVMRVMGELAAIYGLDTRRALAAGLLHDAAKDLAPEAQLALADEIGLEFAHACERHPVYLHAPLGAHLAAQLGERDPAVLDAIVTHSHYGDDRDLDATLAWCLRCADLLAPTAPWQGMRRLRQHAYGGELETAALLLCGWIREYFVAAGVPVHPKIERQYAARCERMGRPGPAFFERW